VELPTLSGTATFVSPGNHSTKVSYEFLRDVHPLEKLLEESVGKALLNGRNILLHVLETSEDREQIN